MACGKLLYQKNMPYIDANVILRYILNDHADLSPKAKGIIESSDIEIPVEVLCEVVYVLKRVYKINQKEIADTLLDFFENTNCLLSHREVIITGLQYFAGKNLDFVDCILAGYYEIEGRTVYTFDNNLERLLVEIRKGKT